EIRASAVDKNALGAPILFETNIPKPGLPPGIIEAMMHRGTKIQTFFVRTEILRIVEMPRKNPIKSFANLFRGKAVVANPTNVSASENTLMHQKHVRSRLLFGSLSARANQILGTFHWAIFDRPEIQPITNLKGALRIRLQILNLIIAHLPKCFNSEA